MMERNREIPAVEQAGKAPESQAPPFQREATAAVNPGDRPGVNPAESGPEVLAPFASGEKGLLWWNADDMKEAETWKIDLLARGVDQVELKPEVDSERVRVLITVDRTRADEIMGYPVEEEEWLIPEDAPDPHPAAPERHPEHGYILEGLTGPTGHTFTARILQAGDKYGLNNCLTWGQPESAWERRTPEAAAKYIEDHKNKPGIEFYDEAQRGKPGFPALGQFTGGATTWTPSWAGGRAADSISMAGFRTGASMRHPWRRSETGPWPSAPT